MDTRNLLEKNNLEADSLGVQVREVEQDPTSMPFTALCFPTTPLQPKPVRQDLPSPLLDLSLIIGVHPYHLPLPGENSHL